MSQPFSGPCWLLFFELSWHSPWGNWGGSQRHAVSLQTMSSFLVPSTCFVFWSQCGRLCSQGAQLLRSRAGGDFDSLPLVCFMSPRNSWSDYPGAKWGSPATATSCESKLRNSIFCHIDLYGEGMSCVALAGLPPAWSTHFVDQAGLTLGWPSCLYLPSTELQAWATPGWSVEILHPRNIWIETAFAFGVGCVVGGVRMASSVWVSGPLKVPHGDAAISKMQIAHFLDFVSAYLDKGWDEGQNCLCSLNGPLWYFQSFNCS